MVQSRTDYEDDDETNYGDSIDRGFIVVVDGLAWGPFEKPEGALGFALKHKPDNLFKLMPLLNPAIVD